MIMMMAISQIRATGGWWLVCPWDTQKYASWSLAAPAGYQAAQFATQSASMVLVPHWLTSRFTAEFDASSLTPGVEALFFGGDLVRFGLEAWRTKPEQSARKPRKNADKTKLCPPPNATIFQIFPQQPERLGVLPIKLRGGLGQRPEIWSPDVTRFREVPKEWNRFREVPKSRFHSWNVRFREVPKWRFLSWNVRFREVLKSRFHSWNVRFREVPKWRFHSWNVRFREVPKSRFHSWNIRFREVPKWRFRSWNVRFREVPKWRFHSWNVRFREVPKSRFHSWNVRFREVPKWRFRSWNVRFREVPKSRFHSWNVRFREVPKWRFHSWNVRSFFEIWYVFAYNMFCVSHSMFFVSHSMFSVTHNMSKRKTVPVHQLLGFSHGLIFWKESHWPGGLHYNLCVDPDGMLSDFNFGDTGVRIFVKGAYTPPAPYQLQVGRFLLEGLKTWVPRKNKEKHHV